MAFMGMIWGVIFLIIATIVIIAIIGTIVTCIVAGIVFLINKNKKAAIIPFSIAGSIIGLFFIIALIGNVSSRFHTVEAPDGRKTTVSSQLYYDYLTALTDYDEEDSHLTAREKLQSFINEEPVLVHCVNSHHRTVLDYALEYCDTEMIMFSVEKGAVLDNCGYALPYKASLECLYGGHTSGDGYKQHGLPPFEDMYAMTEYLIDNGAKLEWQPGSYDDYPNVLFEAIIYICYDNYVEKKELKLLKLIIDSGCPTDTISHDKWYRQHNYTALDLLNQCAKEAEEGVDLYNRNHYIPSWEKVLKNVE